jgi:acyl homoserine lactone synthase
MFCPEISFMDAPFTSGSVGTFAMFPASENRRSCRARVAIARREDLNLRALERLHAFRHEVFIDRLNWRLPLLDGIERDQFDRDDTVYFTMGGERPEEIAACARLLPTMSGSYMLPEVLPELLGDMSAPRDPAVWELSRFASRLRAARPGGGLSLSQPTLDLLASVFEFANGYGVNRLVLATSLPLERLLMREGLGIHRLAPPAKMHGRAYVALYMDVPKP